MLICLVAKVHHVILAWLLVVSPHNAHRDHLTSEFVIGAWLLLYQAKVLAWLLVVSPHNIIISHLVQQQPCMRTYITNFDGPNAWALCGETTSNQASSIFGQSTKFNPLQSLHQHILGVHLWVSSNPGIQDSGETVLYLAVWMSLNLDLNCSKIC